MTNKSDQPVKHYLNFISICAKAGLSAVQLREKDLSITDLFKFGKSLKGLLDAFQIPLIVNDSLDLCLKLDAGGLHLGQDDGDIVIARAALGSNKLLGLTVNSAHQIELANHLPIDYIGVGSIFPTPNKVQCETIWGTGGLQQVFLLSKHPIIAIGGINENNAQMIMEAGACGIAAISAFHDAAHPAITTQNLRNIVDRVFDHD